MFLSLLLIFIKLQWSRPVYYFVHYCAVKFMMTQCVGLYYVVRSDSWFSVPGKRAGVGAAGPSNGLPCTGCGHYASLRFTTLLEDETEG